MNWDEYFFRHVFLAASKSKDPSSQVGAILVKDGTVVSEGYNGFPRGVDDCKLRLNYRPTRLAYTVHAEHNCILNCARNGISTVNSLLYTNAYPCDQCMKVLVQAGVHNVFVHQGGHDAFFNRQDKTNWNETHKDSRIIAKEGGVDIKFWQGKLGIEILAGGIRTII